MGMWSVSAVMFLFIWVSVSPNTFMKQCVYKYYLFLYVYSLRHSVS